MKNHVFYLIKIFKTEKKVNPRNWKSEECLILLHKKIIHNYNMLNKYLKLNLNINVRILNFHKNLLALFINR